MKKPPGLGAQATQLRPLWRLIWVEESFRQFGGETLILFPGKFASKSRKKNPATGTWFKSKA